MTEAEKLMRNRCDLAVACLPVSQYSIQLRRLLDDLLAEQATPATATVQELQKEIEILTAERDSARATVDRLIVANT